MAEAPVLILRTTGILSCCPQDESRTCAFCSAELCLTPQRKQYLREGVRFSCVGCLALIPPAAEILGPRTFSYEELSERTGVKLGAAAQREEPVTRLEPEETIPTVSEEPMATDTKTKCEASGCDVDEILGRDLCAKHYYRVKKAIERGHGSWDDSVFVKRAVAGDFISGHKNGTSPPTPARTKTPKSKKPAGVVLVAKEYIEKAEKIRQILDPPSERVFNLLLELAELDQDDRECVLRYAVKRWLS